MPLRWPLLMSIHPYKTADGTRYQVRWRDANGKARGRSFASKKEANKFDIEVQARRLRGEPVPRASRDTLATVYEEWKELYARPRLSKTTLARYEAAWKPHIKDRHDHHTLAELIAEPQLFEQMLDEMRARGVGVESQRKAMMVMSALFKAAVRWRKVTVNPVLAVPKPPSTRQRIPHPLPPMVVERIRLQMRRRETKDGSGARAIADGCLVTLMAYAGLRPGEALALTWIDVGAQTLAIDKAVSVGEEATTKTKGVRSTPLVEPLASDLADLRAARGKPVETDLLFPGEDGRHWSQPQYNNWRNRVWRPAMNALAGGKPPQPQLIATRPYDCRGSFVSLHLRAGQDPLVVAEWGGHTPRVMFTHYANVIKELKNEPVLPAPEQIERARDAVIQLERAELDAMMADLIEHPTIGSDMAPAEAEQTLQTATKRSTTDAIARAAEDLGYPEAAARLQSTARLMYAPRPEHAGTSARGRP